MGRIRTIKPEFPQSESMGRVSRDARLLFVLLFTVVDDSGRTRGNSRMLASLLYPYDDDAGMLIDEWLSELAAERCIDLYEIDGNTYLQISKWLEHQKIDKPSKSKIPEFVESSRILANHRRRVDDGSGPRSGPVLDQEVDMDQGQKPCAPTVVAVAPVANVVLAKKPKPEKGITNETWEAYADAYQFRYGQRPIRNQSVNGKLAQLVDRLGRDEAPKVAAFFLSSNDQFICKRMHDVGLLLQQCEAFRTQWATGRTMTTTRAQQIDRTSSNFDAAQEAIRMLEARSNT